MSVGYNVSDGSMDFNSGTNLTSGIQDRCCTRWWRSRNGFERWMVIVVIFLSIVIVALSVAVGVLDQIAYPSGPEPQILKPIEEVNYLFDHMEDQVTKASQLMADTENNFNLTLYNLKSVEATLSKYDDDKKKTKRFVDDIKTFERFRRDLNDTSTAAPNNGSTTVGIHVTVSNITEVNETTNNSTKHPTTIANLQSNTTTTSTNQIDNSTAINTTIASMPTTVNAVVANLKSQLNTTKHLLNITSESLENKTIELIHLNNTLHNQTRELNSKIQLLVNQTRELEDLKKELNETKTLEIQKDNQIFNLTKTIESKIEKIEKINKTLNDAKIRIQFLELYINEKTGIFTPLLEILERMDRPINQTYNSVIDAKKLLKKVNQSLYETHLPPKQKEKNQNQTQHMSKLIDELENRLESIKTSFEEMEVQSIAIKGPLQIVQAKLFKDEDNTTLLSAMNDTKSYFSRSVTNMIAAETSLSDINNNLTHTVANMTQTIIMLGKIQLKVETTVKVNTTSVTTPMISLNTTTPLPISNSTENNNLTSNALRSSSTALLSGKLEIFVLVISVVIYQGYGIMI